MGRVKSAKQLARSTAEERLPWRGASPRPKPRSLHCQTAFGVFHERFPDETRPRVLSHDHGDPHVDTNHIRRMPARVRIEGIDQSIAFPRSFPEPFAHVSQHSDASFGQERKRTAGRRGHKCAIQRPVLRRPAPRHVAFRRIGRRDSPEIPPEFGKASPQVEAKLPVRFCSENGVFKIVRMPIPLTAEIEPGMGILMNEKRIF